MPDSGMQDAAGHVFSTPELLESILLQLPLSDLLIRAPLVCHHFHDTISQSIALQQALYFAPKTDAKRSTPNPLLINGNMALFVDKRFKLDNGKKGFAKYSWPNDPAADLKPFKPKSEPQHDSITRKEASWRKMLVIQPPVKVLSIIFETSPYISEEGVTIGMLGTGIFTNYQSFIINKEGNGRLITSGDHGCE
jgi:hypothetical protein